MLFKLSARLAVASILVVGVVGACGGSEMAEEPVCDGGVACDAGVSCNHDGHADKGEACDGQDLAGATCASATTNARPYGKPTCVDCTLVTTSCTSNAPGTGGSSGTGGSGAGGFGAGGPAP